MKLTLKSRDKIRTYDQAIVMGVINCTPDSFYDGSRKQQEQEVLSEVEKHIRNGAEIIDLGGYSTRPGVQLVAVEEELNRIKNSLKWISETYPDTLISVDTFRSEIADFALQNGADIINDISAGSFDERILEIVAKANCPYIAMHLLGDLNTMHETPEDTSITTSVLSCFEQKIELFRQKGIQQIIIDPGFGFSKTMENNFKLLNELEQLHALNLPILVGVSRKRMVWQTLHLSPKEALNGTSVLNTIALLKGAQILRVHDVKEAKECIDLTQKLCAQESK